MVLKARRSRPPSKHDMETIVWVDQHVVRLRQVHHGRHLTRYSRETFLAAMPQFNQAMKLLQQMRAYGAEFGLTPSARSGLVVETKRPKSALQEFGKPS